MPDKHAASLITTSSMVQRASYIEREMDQEFSPPEYQRPNTLARCWMLGRLIQLPGAAKQSLLFEDEGSREADRRCNPTERCRRVYPRGPEGLDHRRLKHWE